MTGDHKLLVAPEVEIVGMMTLHGLWLKGLVSKDGRMRKGSEFQEFRLWELLLAPASRG